jgi:hypothetical protein
MIFHEYTVKIRIAEDLTEDGLTLDKDRLERALHRAFPLARMSGFEVEMVDAPETADPLAPCTCTGSPHSPDCPHPNARL